MYRFATQPKTMSAKNIFRSIVFAALLSAAGVISGCFFGGGLCSYEEISRVKSPDSFVDAVLVQSNCGATTPYGYLLCIVPTGGKYKKDEYLLNADHVDGLEIHWRQPKLLEIRYREARIFHFSNFWHTREVQDFAYVVELRLVPSSPTFSLSERDRWIKK